MEENINVAMTTSKKCSNGNFFIGTVFATLVEDSDTLRIEGIKSGTNMLLLCRHRSLYSFGGTDLKKNIPKGVHGVHQNKFRNFTLLSHSGRKKSEETRIGLFYNKISAHFWRHLSKLFNETFQFYLQIKKKKE